LYEHKGSPAEYNLDLAVARGWLLLHESGVYVKLTPAGADLRFRARSFLSSSHSFTFQIPGCAIVSYHGPQLARELGILFLRGS
jgi:hypothetical protein